MTFKKIMSAIMAGAMVLSMGMTAFATTAQGQVDLEGEEGYEIEIGSSTQVATIKVQVPEVVGFIVNPYRLEAKNEEIGVGTAGEGQIVSPLQKIVNKSDFAIKIGGTIYAYENNPDEAKLKSALSSAGSDGSQPKEAVISFIAEAGTASDTDALTAGTCKVDLSTALGETGAALTAIELTNKDGATPAYTFNFDGSAQDAPTVAWTEADTFGATIAFTFTAVANAASGGGTPTPAP